MPEVFVVFDTHVLLGAIVRSNQDSIEAYDKMIERCNKILISERVRKQYLSIIHKYHQRALFLIRALQDLEEINKIKKVGSGNINSVNIKDLQTNDRPFVELACNKAKFLLTNDQGLHSKHREFIEKCRFIVKFPRDYAEII